MFSLIQIQMVAYRNTYRYAATYWFIYWLLVLVTQSCPFLCDPMNCSLPGSSAHEILQTRILEWVAIPFSRVCSWPRDWTGSPALQADSLLSITREDTIYWLVMDVYINISFLSQLRGPWSTGNGSSKGNPARNTPVFQIVFFSTFSIKGISW